MEILWRFLRCNFNSKHKQSQASQAAAQRPRRTTDQSNTGKRSHATILHRVTQQPRHKFHQRTSGSNAQGRFGILFWMARVLGCSPGNTRQSCHEHGSREVCRSVRLHLCTNWYHRTHSVHRVPLGRHTLPHRGEAAPRWAVGLSDE